jgi:hypothetical protein
VALELVKELLVLSLVAVVLVQTALEAVQQMEQRILVVVQVGDTVELELVNPAVLELLFCATRKDTESQLELGLPQLQLQLAQIL